MPEPGLRMHRGTKYFMKRFMSVQALKSTVMGCLDALRPNGRLVIAALQKLQAAVAKRDSIADMSRNPGVETCDDTLLPCQTR